MEAINQESYKVASTTEQTFEVFNTESFIVDHIGKHKEPNQIGFLLYSNGKMMKENRQPVLVSITKEEALELGVQLLKMVSQPIPLTGLEIDDYNGWCLSVHQPEDESGELTDEPCLVVEGLEQDSIPKNESLSTTLTNKSARELIQALATIV